MIHAVKDAAIPIVQAHMTEKNWTKIGTLAGFYGSPDVSKSGTKLCIIFHRTNLFRSLLPSS